MTRPDASHKPVLTALATTLLLWPGLRAGAASGLISAMQGWLVAAAAVAAGALWRHIGGPSEARLETGRYA